MKKTTHWCLETSAKELKSQRGGKDGYVQTGKLTDENIIKMAVGNLQKWKTTQENENEKDKEVV